METIQPILPSISFLTLNKKLNESEIKRKSISDNNLIKYPTKIIVTSSHAVIKNIPVKYKMQNKKLEKSSNTLNIKPIKIDDYFENQSLEPLNEETDKNKLKSFNQSYLEMHLNSNGNNEISNIIHILLKEEEKTIKNMIESKLISISKEQKNIDSIVKKESQNVNEKLINKKINDIDLFIEEIKSRIKKAEEDLFIIENSDFVTYFDPSYSTISQSRLSKEIVKQPFFNILKKQQLKNLNSISYLQDKLDSLEIERNKIKEGNTLFIKFDQKKFLSNFDKETEKAREKVKIWKEEREKIQLKREMNIESIEKELEIHKKEENQRIKEKLVNDRLDYINKLDVIKNKAKEKIKDFSIKPDKSYVQSKYTYQVLEEKFKQFKLEENNKYSTDLMNVKLQQKIKLKRISFDEISHFNNRINEKLIEIESIKNNERHKEKIQHKMLMNMLKEKINNMKVKGFYKKKALEIDRNFLNQKEGKNHLFIKNKKRLNDFISNLPKIKVKEAKEEKEVREFVDAKEDKESNSKTLKTISNITTNDITSKLVRAKNNYSTAKEENKAKLKLKSKYFKFAIMNETNNIHTQRSIESQSNKSNIDDKEIITLQRWEQQSVKCDNMLNSIKSKLNLLSLSKS